MDEEQDPEEKVAASRILRSSSVSEEDLKVAGEGKGWIL